MWSILKPPLGMRKHMDSTHSPQSSLVHECQNLTNPPPHGQKWCNKKQQIPHPLGHKKVPKPLVTPINAPYLPGVGGLGFQLTGALTAAWALRALIDFTLSNARQFYSPMREPHWRERVNGFSLRYDSMGGSWNISFRCIWFWIRCHFPISIFLRLGKAGWYCVIKAIFSFLCCYLCFQGTFFYLWS